MLDAFDLALLNSVQHDDSRTAEALAERIPLSPSAIARRLRRLRSEGWIARTIGLLAPRLTATRLRALVSVQLSEHANLAGKEALSRRLLEAEEVQWCYEITGGFDLIALVDCPHMAAFNALTDRILAADATVRRYETSFVKREVKFAPFARLTEPG